MPRQKSEHARRNTLAYFLVSLAVTFPALVYWLRGLFENTWVSQTLVLLPALCLLGVAAVWGVYAARVSGKSDLDRASIFWFGFGAIAAWFALAAAALFVVPWMGNMYAAFPNPLGLLMAAGLGFASTWFCAKGLARTLDRRPAPDLVSWLLFAALGSCVAVSECRGASQRRANESAELQQLPPGEAR